MVYILVNLDLDGHRNETGLWRGPLLSSHWPWVKSGAAAEVLVVHAGCTVMAALMARNISC